MALLLLFLIIFLCVMHYGTRITAVLFMEAIFVFFKSGRLCPPFCALGTSFYTVSEGRDLMTYVSDNYTSYIVHLF